MVRVCMPAYESSSKEHLTRGCYSAMSMQTNITALGSQQSCLQIVTKADLSP